MQRVATFPRLVIYLVLCVPLQSTRLSTEIGFETSSRAQVEHEGFGFQQAQDSLTAKV
jgi:hypothetical protein